MLLVLIVALVVVGPKDLPKLMRKMGQWASKARGMADQFRNSFDEMARQSELDELRKELDELRHTRPLADTEQAISQKLHGPAVSFSEERPAAPEPAGETPKTSEPAEPIPEGDQHPPPP
jgi:sec-independent protein translocase protein TatB